MQIRILNNGVKNTSAMQQGLEKARQLCLQLGLQLNIEYLTIDKIFDAQPLHTDVVNNGFGVTPQEILNVGGSNADIVCLISPWVKILPSNWSTGNPINPCTYDLDTTSLTNTLAMEIMEEWYNDFPDVLTQYFLHELCHSVYDKTGIKPDLTHQQYANAQYSQKSPIDYYLYLLSVLLPSYNAPQALPSVFLSRVATNTKETIGHLRVPSNLFGCDTLELPWAMNQSNISRIPPGQYLCQWKFMLRELTYHYQVMNVPNRSGIFIHSGTYFFDSKGCIILGSVPQDVNKDGELDLINSKLILTAFENLMNKKDFTLIIK